VNVVAAVLALVVPFFFAALAGAQTRLSDKDLEQRIKNTNEDVKRFRVSNTNIRKTTQEKDAKALELPGSVHADRQVAGIHAVRYQYDLAMGEN
jgi:hypothetical protein